MNGAVKERSTNSLWVFGYGSLCWNPGFQFASSSPGHILGYKRRFFQGNVTHRGTPENPGRVATLLKEDQDSTYGIAFELMGQDALKYLENREVSQGGYNSSFTTFYSVDGRSFPVLLYIATMNNSYWLGPSSESDIAKQVVNCKGNSGHNVEYVVRLADWFRRTFPNVKDEHLFAVDERVRSLVYASGVQIESLMGEESYSTSSSTHQSTTLETVSPELGAPYSERTLKFAFKMEVDHLRCLNL